MKKIQELIGERREPKHYTQNSTILCNVDELDEFCECIRKGAEAINFNFKSKENEFHIINQALKTLEDLSRVGDVVEFKVRLAPDEKEGDR